MNTDRHRTDRGPEVSKLGVAADERSTTSRRRARQRIMGVLESFSKQQSASPGILALGLIKREFGDAVEYSATFTALRGMMLFFGLVAAATAFYGTYSNIEDIRDSDMFFQIFGGVMAFIFALAGVWSALVTARLELFVPSDQPIIFDRKNRRVYHMHQEQKSGLVGLFQTWPLRVSTYNWSLVDAQHVAELAVNSATVTRRHQLRFVVRRSSDDPTVVAMFQVGTAQLMGDATVPMVWEHIRRFMEETGRLFRRVKVPCRRSAR